VDGDFLFRLAAASAAYLTVSETFPLGQSARSQSHCSMRWHGNRRRRRSCIFGRHRHGSRSSVFAGYFSGSPDDRGGAIAWRYCIAAERRPLESVARPLAFVE